MSDWIELENMTFDCIVGVLPEEQRSVQPLRVDVKMAVNLESSARSGNLSETVNYAGVQQQIMMIAQCGRWRLIESLGMAIARLLLSPPAPAEERAQISTVKIRIAKPTILTGAVPAVSLSRDEAWLDLDTRMLPPATWLDVLEETPRGGAYRAHVEPGKTWELPPNASVLVVAGQLTADGVPLAAGQELAPSAAKAVTASGDMPGTLLVVTQPPLDV